MQTLNYGSNAVPTTLTAALGSAGNPQVNAITNWPTTYPFKLLVDWGSFIGGATQEAMYVTGAPTGSPGAYIVPVTRGADNTTASTHLIGAQVVHGVSAEDFLMNPYGQSKLLSQKSQALTPWLNALANRRYARCNVACLGDSITEGQHAVLPPTGFANRWVTRLADLLRNNYPVPNITGGGRGFIGAAGSGETSFQWPTTVVGSPTAATTLGPKSEFLQLNTTGQSITWVLTGDSADIMWTQAAGGGTFSWAVDGGATTNVSTAGGSTVDGKITHISLGAPGTHYLTLAWVSGNSDIDGVIEYYGDYATGIQTHDCGHFGWTSGQWTSPLATGAAGPAAAIAALSPGLVLIELGVNDQFGNVVPSTFQSNLQTIISDLQGQMSAPLPSFVIVMLPPRSNQGTYTYPWSQYVQAAWNVALADTSGPAGTPIVTVCDFTLGPWMPGADADTYGFWQAGDLVHPGDKGHQAIAERIASFLTLT